MSTSEPASGTEGNPPPYPKDDASQSIKSQDTLPLYTIEGIAGQESHDSPRIRPMPPPFASDKNTDRPFRLLDATTRFLMTFVPSVIFLIVVLGILGFAVYATYWIISVIWEDVPERYDVVGSTIYSIFVMLPWILVAYIVIRMVVEKVKKAKKEKKQVGEGEGDGVRG